MNITIVSDIHDHREHCRLLIQRLQSESPDFLILLWDYGAPGAIMRWLLDLQISTHAIRGNNDGEIYKTMKLFEEHKDHAHIAHNSYDWLELDGKTIFLTHYDDLARPMASTGLYDAVFYGHNHLAHHEKIGNCLLANPGSVLWNRTPASFALWDTEMNSFEIVEL